MERLLVKDLQNDKLMEASKSDTLQSNEL